MKALILSTATGGGHNTAAHAVMEALTERGVECRFEDCVAFGGQKLSATVSNVYVKFVQAAPDAFGRLYRFAKAISTPRNCECGRRAPLAMTATRPWSRVNNSRTRLVSRQATECRT